MSCDKVCYFCDKWKTMKEKHNNCETLKERSRAIRRLSYQAKKKRLAEKQTEVIK